MCYAGGLDRSYAFQFDWLCTQMVEQPDTTAKQDRHHIYIYFVKQPRLETLLQDTGSAYDDVLVPRGFPGLTNGAFNAISNKGEWRSFLDPFLGDGMGDNETRCPGGMAAPAPGDIKGSPSPHSRPVCSERLLKEFGALR